MLWKKKKRQVQFTGYWWLNMVRWNWYHSVPLCSCHSSGYKKSLLPGQPRGQLCLKPRLLRLQACCVYARAQKRIPSYILPLAQATFSSTWYDQRALLETDQGKTKVVTAHLPARSLSIPKAQCQCYKSKLQRPARANTWSNYLKETHREKGNEWQQEPNKEKCVRQWIHLCS